MCRVDAVIYEYIMIECGVCAIVTVSAAAAAAAVDANYSLNDSSIAYLTFAFRNAIHDVRSGRLEQHVVFL